ncbi:MAG: hypothetical protein HYW93_07105 [Thaumarchaeota archaeon]|nr:hypothetical protein [Nitrososphaerota archaeon]
MSIDPANGVADFKPVRAIIRHKNTKNVYRVFEKWGCTRVTEDHSLLAIEDDRIVLAKPTELSGRHLLRADRIPAVAGIATIDVYEVLRPHTYTSIYKGRKKNLRAHCDDEWVWYSWTKQMDPIKVKRLIQLGTPEFRALVELLGAYVAEGSSSTPDPTKSRMGASMASSDIGRLNQLRDNYMLLFKGTTPSIVPSNQGTRHLVYRGSQGQLTELDYDDRTQKMQMMNKLSAVFFKAFCGQKSHGKEIPSFVYHIPDEYKRIFLENIVKGDGSRMFGAAYSDEYRQKNFRCETKSVKLAGGLSVLLSQLGIRYTLRYRKSKQTYCFATSEMYSRRRSTPVVTQEPYNGYVYDLSVDENHTFVDSCGNIALKNTDSLFTEKPSQELISKVTKWAEEDLAVELDVDKIYRYVAFSERKKNYFGVLQDGTADIKGLTGKKSVHGSTPILARIDGKITFTRVEDVHRKFQEGRAIELLTISNELTTDWSVISDASAHVVSDVYEIKTGKGRILKLSGDHSVYLMDNFGNLHCKETREIKEGDVIVGARFIPNRSSEKRLDVEKHLSSRVIVRSGFLYSDKPHATIGVPIRKSLLITEELAVLLGIFTAEGNVASRLESRNNSITQSLSENPEVCEQLKKAWLATFGWDIKVHARRKNKNLRFYVPVLYAEFFRSLCGDSSANKHVPEFIFNSSKAIIGRYLRGLFSGDGYSDARRINMASMSERLLIQVAYLLSYFDIDTRLRRAYLPKYDKYYYQLSVIGSFSRKRFMDEIGFMQERYQKKPKTFPRNKELIPLTTAGLISIKKAITNRAGVTRFRHINMHDTRHFNMMLLHRYNTVIGDLNEHASPSEQVVLANVRRMINSHDVTYDEVVSVTRVIGKCKMYDFSVPKYERFVAGNLPTLLHNSQTPEFLKKTFYEALDILGKVYGPSDFERARANIKGLLTSAVSKLRNREIPVDQLAFNVMMGKSISGFSGTTPQHVRAAKLLQERGKEVKAGDIISYVKTKTPPSVKPVSLAKPEEIDVDKYLEYAQAMFDQMLDALGFSFDEIMGSTTLDLFWS